MQSRSETDWERVKRDIASEAPIEFDPDDELYDPNDDAAVEAAWADGVVTATRRAERERTEEIWLRVPPDVVHRYQAKGGNWQGRMDEALRKGPFSSSPFACGKLHGSKPCSRR